MKLTRRQSLYLGGGAVVVAGAGAGAKFLLRKRYAPSPYDDLLAGLQNRDGAAQIGETVLAQTADFEPLIVADALRHHIAGRPLADVLTEEAAKDQVLEAGGWVMPKTLGLICALAAKAAA